MRRLYFPRCQKDVRVTQQDAWDRLIQIWNEQDEAERLGLIHVTLSEHVVFEDPHQSAAIMGSVNFAAYISRFRAAIVGATVRSDGFFQEVRSHARGGFIIERGGSVFSRGTFFLAFNQDGKVARIVGFMDQEPQR